jgi:hypothetical protein
MGRYSKLTAIAICFEHFVRQVASGAFRRRRRVLVAVSAAFMTVLLGTAAEAVVVGTVMDTTVNPASYPGWTEGDPGWNNVTQSGFNYVYLGDNWVLTARHIVAQTATFSTGSFTRIASQNYIISNPPPNLADGVSLTPQTDLRLFRIRGNVGLPALTIASESPTATGADGAQMVYIGQGRPRAESETHWALNLSSPPLDWISAEVTTGGNVHGYKTNDGREKRFGTNRLEDPSSSAFTSDAFDEILSPTTAVMPLMTSDGITRDVISMVTIFNQQSDAGALPLEAQAVSEDSGGAVFYNRGTQENPDWVLSGIVNATLIYGNQSRRYAVYGNSTTFADLSYYNQPYKFSICDIMKTCGAYSEMGDVNIDGVVAGDGTGNVTEDDVAAFVAGWGNNNLAGKGDYETWKKGDLNLDGLTDVEDFLLLRGALNGPISNTAMQAIFGVPEPASAISAMLAAGILGLFGRRRRRR